MIARILQSKKKFITAILYPLQVPIEVYCGVQLDKGHIETVCICIALAMILEAIGIVIWMEAQTDEINNRKAE
jgi:hypothetical protein